MIKVGQLMKKDLVCVQTGTTIAAAAVVMRQQAIGSVLVERHGDFIGIVTESDIVRKVVGLNRLPERIFVEEIMSTPVIGIEDSRPIFEAADLMESHQTRHLAVTKEGTTIGVVSVWDLLQPVSVSKF
jgi:CBS domain-containing protein